MLGLEQKLPAILIYQRLARVLTKLKFQSHELLFGKSGAKVLGRAAIKAVGLMAQFI